MNQQQMMESLSKNKPMVIALTIAVLASAWFAGYVFFGGSDTTRIDTSESACFGKTVQAYDFVIDKQDCVPMDISACAASRFETSKEACLKKNGIVAATGTTDQPAKKKK